jgi:UTP--glucose-1-phosphate uridylyltransferase
MKIRNAVVPVAGLGTRLLPLTKSQPKEMLSVGRKPVVQYVLEELQHCGVSRLCFVTARGKHSIEDHFDPDSELRKMLEKDPGKRDLLDALAFEQNHLRIFYARQSEPLGLGHAVMQAREFVEDEPFVLALGDCILTSHNGSHIVERMMDCFVRRRARCVVALEEVPRERISRYGVVAPGKGKDVVQITDIVEKPDADKAPSNLAISARYVFSPVIFDALDRTKPGRNNEVQLTDAIRIMLRERGGVYGVRLAPGEERHDIGNFQDYFRSFIEFALRDPEYGAPLGEYLRKRIG